MLSRKKNDKIKIRSSTCLVFLRLFFRWLCSTWILYFKNSAVFWDANARLL